MIIKSLALLRAGRRPGESAKTGGKRYVSPLLGVIAAVSICWGADPEAALHVTGAKVVSQQNRQAQVEVQIQNLTGQTVTAYGYEVVGRYADGSQLKSEQMIDKPVGGRRWRDGGRTAGWRLEGWTLR